MERIESQWALSVVRKYHGILHRIGKDIFEAEEMLEDDIGRTMPFMWQFRVAGIVRDFQTQATDIIKTIAELRKEYQVYGF